MTESSSISVLKETQNYIVYLHLANIDDSNYIVSFRSWQSKTVVKPNRIFGEAFFIATRRNAIGIAAKYNCWYQYSDVEEVMDFIRGRFDFATLQGYGSSMGGFACLNFASALGLVRAVAIAPQFSIAPEMPPFERRWQSEYEKVGYFKSNFANVNRNTTAVFMLDPLYFPDRRHFDLLRESFPNFETLFVPGGEHEPARPLARSGALRRIMDEVFRGTYDYASFPGTLSAILRDQSQSSET